jgi:hypothetical protein
MWEEIRRAYTPGGETNPSFLRYEYVTYNSVSKSRNLGIQENLLAVVRGSIGSQAGAGTLYFKVRLMEPCRLGVRLINLSAQAARWISVGLLDEERKPIEVNEQGFGVPPRREYNDPEDDPTAFQPGTYYFTITSNQWVAQAFELQLAVVGFTRITGGADLAFPCFGRLSMVQIFEEAPGAVTLQLDLEADIPSRNKMKLMDGVNSYILSSGGSSLAIKIAGAAQLTLQMEARIMGLFEIEGVNPFNFTPQGTLTKI